MSQQIPTTGAESSRADDATHCPSCGKYVGAYETCPYCLAGMGSRIELKLVRRIALVGSVIGVLALWLAARGMRIPEMKIGDIAFQNNMALVQVSGTVVDVSTTPLKNGFRFTLDDGTGRLGLLGFDKLTRFQEGLGDRFPVEGDELSVVGQLQISEKFGASMFLQSPDRVTLKARSQPVQRGLGEISREELGKVYDFQGQVTGKRSFSGGWTLQLQDDTGQQALALREAELATIPDQGLRDQLLELGSVIQIRAKVDAYRDELQLRLVQPERAGHVTFLERKALPGDAPPTDPPIPLTDLEHHAEGDLVTVHVTVQEARSIKGVGKRLTVNDGTSQETLFLYDPVLSELADPAGMTRKGARLAVLAKIETYRNQRQLVPVTGRAVALRGE